MAAPTRAQIEADVALPTFSVTLDGVDVSADVVDISGQLEQTSGGDGIGFGAVVQPAADIAISRSAFLRAWEDRRVTIAYGFDTSDREMHFRGVVTRRDRGMSSGSWSARGFDALIEAVDIRSPLFLLRPVATRTTATSVEDPANPAFRAGLVNFIFWQAGGRPLEQQASYPDAAFYYRCGTSILVPLWSWINGDNGMRALENLCRAAGGIVYQDSTGVMRYVEPFALASAAPTFTYTDAPLTAAQRVAGSLGNYAEHRESAETTIAVKTVRSQFVQRYLQGIQEIYADKTPIALEAGQSLTLDLDLQLPCYRLDRVEIQAALAARARKATTSEITVTATLTAAQRISATLTNTTGERATVWQIAAYGAPLVAGEEGSASYTAAVDRPSSRDLELEDSPYIQSRSFALRRCRMYWDFYSQPRPIVTLSGCGFDPDRYLGEVVNLTSQAWGVSAVPHRIVAIRPSRAGALMEVDLVPIAGLPKNADFYIGGQSYADATQLQLAY